MKNYLSIENQTIVPFAMMVSILSHQFLFAISLLLALVYCIIERIEQLEISQKSQSRDHIVTNSFCFPKFNLRSIRLTNIQSTVYR